MYPDYYRKNVKKQHSPETEAQPWHQMDGETDYAFKGFEFYAELGYSRTLMKVAMRLYGDKWERSIRFVEGWAKDFNWEKRAALFDAFLSKHHEDFKNEQKRRSEYKIAKAMPDITDVAVDIAVGKRRGDRVQGSMIMSLMDRGGPAKQESAKQQTNINFKIQAPDLPDAVMDQFEEAEVVNEAPTSTKEVEDLKTEARKLRPTFD